MKLVLDASVAVAAVRPREPSHQPSRRRLERVLRGPDVVVVPSIFTIEVAAALGRVGEDPLAIRALVAAFDRPPHEIVTIGRVRARQILEVAVACRLRAADAIYVWLAANRRIPLCTLDEEVLERARTTCQMVRP
jgi:predicted nucleic acid-binding protein